MPQKPIPEDVESLIRDLRKEGWTYAQIHREVGVSMGKIAMICAPNKSSPLIDRVNKLERRIDELKMMEHHERWYEGILYVVLTYLTGVSDKGDLLFSCPECTKGAIEFFEKEDPNKPGTYTCGFACNHCHHEIQPYI